MKDLLDFQRFQIQSLQNRICELENQNNILTGYVFEALDEQCPQEYKTIIKQAYKDGIIQKAEGANQYFDCTFGDNTEARI